MNKNIVICLDGTWNKPDEPDASISRETNVRSLYEICIDDNERDQIAYYDRGVGTNWFDKKLGGLHGWGLSENVREAYSYLSDNYEEGDKVFLFGFSRGAYTARSLAGLLFRCGLLPKSQNTTSRINELYDAYKDKDIRRMESYKSSNSRCPIALLGVWDTVGALGIPAFFLRRSASVSLASTIQS